MTVAEAEPKNQATGVVVTAVAAPVVDVESQQKQQAPPETAGVAPTADDDVGKGLGIAMVVLLVVGFVCTFFIPIISFVCVIATMVIASTLTCGCCCASDYNLKPNVKKFATATLVSLVLMFVVQIIWLVSASAVMGTEVSNTGTISSRTAEGTTTSMMSVVMVWLIAYGTCVYSTHQPSSWLRLDSVIVGAISLVLNVMAIIFAALYTWGRNVCA
ncbi:hypothetical protein ACHAWF_010319 [Thalassiosira exigua]